MTVLVWSDDAEVPELYSTQTVAQAAVQKRFDDMYGVVGTWSWRPERSRGALMGTLAGNPDLVVFIKDLAAIPVHS